MIDLNDDSTPIKLAVIGTGDGDAVTSVKITTPVGNPNGILKVVTPILGISIRFINTFLTVLSGILLGAMSTNVIEASDFIHLVYKCAGLSLAGAGVGLIKDLITVFGNLEKKFPLLTGSV